MGWHRRMKFTPGQVQEILQLSPAAFRHWKTALPPLANRNGYKPCFPPGDLLALALVKALTEDVGIRVGQLAPLSTELFDRCGEPWAALERSALIIEPLSRRLTIVPEARPISPNALSIFVPLRPVIASLRQRLLLDQPDASQEPLRFPPTALAGSQRGRVP